MGKVIKWVVILFVLAIGVNVIKEAMKANTEVDARIALKQACARQAQTAGAVPADKVEAVCACATDRTAKALGPDRFIRLSKVTDAPEADRKVLLESLASCVASNVPTR